MARPDAFLTLKLVLLLHLLARSVDAYNLLLNDTAGNYNYDELCPARGVVVVVNVCGTRGDHLLCVCGLLVAAVAVPLRRL